MCPPNAGSPPPTPWIEKGQCLIHIGVFKTGTTALQDALARRRDELREHGVVYPLSGLNHNRAAMAALSLKRPWTGYTVPGMHNWKMLAAESRSPDMRTIVSSEMFCQATDEQATTIIDDLGQDRTKVLITLRPLEKIIQSSWQEFVKSGLGGSYEEWVKVVLQGPGVAKPKFWRRNVFGRIVERWVRFAGAENVTVMLVDPREPHQLHQRFEALVGLPKDFLASGMSNRSLTAAEVEVIRALNHRVIKDVSRLDQRRLVRKGAVRHAVDTRVPAPDEPRITTPAWVIERARELGADAPARILATGAHVIGDVCDLAPTDPPKDVETTVPTTIPVEAAVLMLEGMMRESVAWMEDIKAELAEANAQLERLRGPEELGLASRNPAKRLGQEAARRLRTTRTKEGGGRGGT